MLQLADCVTFRASIMQEFYDSIEKHRFDVIENLVKKYRTIPQLLGKMEEVVAGSNSGKSTHMASYYQYWERCLYDALNTMILTGMTQLSHMMQSRSRRTCNDSTNSMNVDKKLPLFKVLHSHSHTSVRVHSVQK
jgi:dynein heavy chain, axonemal